MTRWIMNRFQKRVFLFFHYISLYREMENYLAVQIEDEKDEREKLMSIH